MPQPDLRTSSSVDGFVIAKAESHGPHFLDLHEGWTPVLAMAKRFSQHYVAERTRIRVGGTTVLDGELAKWLKSAIIRVGVPSHLRS